jgi:tRNA U34 5-carboxymethylaminomethyl modifying enzyme MnmG/GidA
LTPISYEAGLADKYRYDYTMRKYETTSDLVEFFDKTPLKPEVVNPYLESVSSSKVDSRKRISDLVSRPQVKLSDIFEMVPRGTFLKNNIDIEASFASPLSGLLSDDVRYYDLLRYGNYQSLDGQFTENTEVSYKDAAYVLKFNTEYPVSDLESSFINNKVDSNYRREILDSCEIAIKYKGYIQREQQMAEKIMRLENLLIPEDFDFDKVESLSIECRQKLKKYAPRTIAQASRISGISPADVSVLLVYFGR